MKVKDAMAVRAGDLVTAEEGDSLADVARLLGHADVGAVVVPGPAGARGIVTERDVVRAVASGEDLERAQVRDFMTPDPVSVDEEAPLGEAVAAMNHHAVRHLLVTAGGRVAGIVSARDLLDALAGSE